MVSAVSCDSSLKPRVRHLGAADEDERGPRWCRRDVRKLAHALKASLEEEDKGQDGLRWTRQHSLRRALRPEGLASLRLGLCPPPPTACRSALIEWSACLEEGGSGLYLIVLDAAHSR